jgi:hypothetical protein
MVQLLITPYNGLIHLSSRLPGHPVLLFRRLHVLDERIAAALKLCGLFSEVLAGVVAIKNPPKFQGVKFSGSPGRTRTADKVVNSHLLYQLSYRGMG